MVLLILYLTVSWIFNFMINSFFLITFNVNNIEFSIFKILMLVTIINFIKIANQNILIKLIRRQINHITCLNFEFITDYIKIFLLSVLVLNYKKFTSSYSILTYFVVSVINLFILIIQVITNHYKPNFFLQSRNDLEIQTQNEIYITFRQDYNLENYVSSENKNITCSICLEEQQINEDWSIILCNHEFHKKCIFEWLKRNNNCPICRFNI